MNYWIFAAAALLPFSGAAAQDVAGSGSMKYASGSGSGSVYSAYSSTVFSRGGYAFAASDNSDFDESVMGSIGWRKAFGNASASGLSFETELLYAHNSESGLILGTPIDAKVWTLTGLLGLRYDIRTRAGVNPFFSVGVGPSYIKTKISSLGGSASGDDITFAYSGRAGIDIKVSDRFSFEPAYRYTGTTQSGLPGVHSAELGLNLRF